MKKPTIVTLVGSTRFYPAFQEANFRETMAGKILLSVGFYPHAQAEMHGEDKGITPEQKEALDRLHFCKIDLSSEILVLNVGGYIGDSTRREISYAQAHGKLIRWLEPPAAPLPPQSGLSYDQCIAAGLEVCHSQRDGDCTWKDCPQNREGEPDKTGRHCPLDWDRDSDYQ